jgi:hypothetical protein
LKSPPIKGDLEGTDGLKHKTMKQTYLNLFSILIFLLAFGACKKETTQPGAGTSGLTIVNGVVGSNVLRTNFNGTKLGVPYYRNLDILYYGYSKSYNSYSGQLQLGLYQDTTSKPVYNLSLEVPVNTIHTLFLMGTPQEPEQLYTTDQLPYHAPADSVIGIRFVNISRGTAPVSVNLVGQANGSEVQSLSYKGATSFKNYPAGLAISSYKFEFRDQASGTLLDSYTLDGINVPGFNGSSPTTLRNKNFTLVLLGAPNIYSWPLSRVMIVN